MVKVTSKEEIYEKVKDVIIEKLHVSESDVRWDANFIDDLGADSLDIIEITMQIENELGVSISDEDAQNIATIKDLVDYIANKMGISDEE